MISSHRYLMQSIKKSGMTSRPVQDAVTPTVKPSMHVTEPSTKGIAYKVRRKAALKSASDSVTAASKIIPAYKVVADIKCAFDGVDDVDPALIALLNKISVISHFAVCALMKKIQRATDAALRINAEIDPTVKPSVEPGSAAGNTSTQIEAGNHPETDTAGNVIDPDSETNSGERPSAIARDQAIYDVAVAQKRLIDSASVAGNQDDLRRALGMEPAVAVDGDAYRAVLRAGGATTHAMETTSHTVTDLGYQNEIRRKLGLHPVPSIGKDAYKIGS